MTSAVASTTFFREGRDLDEILAELDDEYPDRVQVVDVAYDRVGGVLGFFAQRNVGVRYTLTDGDDVEPREPVAYRPALIEPAGSPLDALLSAAEAQDIVATGRAPRETPPAAGQAPTNVEFARMLLDVANAKAAQRRAVEQAQAEPVTRPAAAIPAVVVPPRAAASEVVVEPATPASECTPAQFLALFDAAPQPEPMPEPMSQPMSQPTPAALAAPVAVPLEPMPLEPMPLEPMPLEPMPAAPPPAGRHQLAVPADQPAAAQPPVERASGYQHAADQPHASAPRRRAPGAHRAGDEAAGRTEFSLRRQLAEIGVPLEWIPQRTADAYWVIEQLATRVPTAPVTAARPGEVLIVVGPARDAVRTAHDLCARLRIDADGVLGVGCPAGAVAPGRDVQQPWAVAAAAAEARAAARGPLVIVVATDGGDPEALDADESWLRDTVRAAAADRMWLCVDATRKSADLRTLIGTVGRPDALAVVGAARTSSPASVWELGVPIALLDGRSASRGAWAALLIDKLAALES